MSLFHSHWLPGQVPKISVANTQICALKICVFITSVNIHMTPRYSKATTLFAQWQLQYKLCACVKARHKSTNSEEDEKLKTIIYKKLQT